MVRVGFVVLLVLVFAGLAYIRLAPSDTARWHVALANREPGNYPAQAGFEAYRVVSDPQILIEFHRIASMTPHTTVLAGSPEAGMTTYVTRSRLMGYPDYTTAQLQNDGDGGFILAIHGRARFGAGDMGVNQARITSWLEALALPVN